MSRPTPAAAYFPYHDHRTVAEVDSRETASIARLVELNQINRVRSLTESESAEVVSLVAQEKRNRRKPEGRLPWTRSI